MMDILYLGIGAIAGLVAGGAIAGPARSEISSVAAPTRPAWLISAP